MSEQNLQKRSALAVIADLRGGKAVDELSASLCEVTQAALATSQKGKVVLTFEIVPDKNIGENAIVLHDSIKVTIPKARKKPTLMFSDAEGSVTREDPNQMTLNLSEDGKVQRIKK